MQRIRVRWGLLFSCLPLPCQGSAFDATILRWISDGDAAVNIPPENMRKRNIPVPSLLLHRVLSDGVRSELETATTVRDFNEGLTQGVQRTQIMFGFKSVDDYYLIQTAYIPSAMFAFLYYAYNCA